MNVFIIISSAYAIAMYSVKQFKLLQLVLIILSCSYIASLSELKAFIVELAILFILAFLFSDFSNHKLTMVLFGIISLIITVNILTTAFPEWQGYFSIANIIESSSSEGGYTGSGDLNRLTAISEINNKYFKDNSLKLIGYGLGSCDYSDSYSFLNSTFFSMYSYLHYTWIFYAMLYLELGAIGLILFTAIFVIIYFQAKKIYKINTGYSVFMQIMIILCFFITIYDSTFRTEAAYMIYFILSIPFIITKEKIILLCRKDNAV